MNHVWETTLDSRGSCNVFTFKRFAQALRLVSLLDKANCFICKTLVNVKQNTANSFITFSDILGDLAAGNSNISQKIQKLDAKMQELAANVSSNLTLEVGQTNLQVILTNQSLIAGEDLKISQSNARIDSLQIDKNNGSFSIVVITLPVIIGNSSGRLDSLNKSNSLYFSPNSTLLIVDVFDAEENFEKLGANISYTINITKSPCHDIFSTDIQNLFKESEKIQELSYSCRYVDDKTSSFSPKGCTLVGKEEDAASCSCNHTTVFAVLLSINSFKIPRKVKVK